MLLLRHQNISRHTPRTGFTLVEMLVSVALVLLMMSMFAAIFQMATGSVSKQRGIAENDQRARTITTILKADIAKRSFQYVQPFYPTEDPATSATPFSNRRGYIYISTNDPASGHDDLLQFTVDASLVAENPDASPYFGAAKQLIDPAVTDSEVLTLNPNQPEADDGTLFPNGVASSPVAEVCYFLRNGALYRRVMLIRKPLPLGGEDLQIQPTSNVNTGPDPRYIVGNGFSYVDPLSGTTASDDFWRHFDFSAVPVITSGAVDTAEFVGVDALTNDVGPSSGPPPASLGNPAFRFGFNRATGLSREHTAFSANALFMGRYLHAETSAFNFNWPIALSSIGNPMDVTGPALLIDSTTGVITEFQEPPPAGPPVTTGSGRGGERRMEDLLLANVHEFRVELWDDRLGRYTTPSHQSLNAAGIPGDYHFSRRINTAYGPLAGGIAVPDAVFDTWHPGPLGGGLAAESPPYMPYVVYPPVQSINPPGPSPVTMAGPIGTYWRPNGTYSASDVVFAVVPTNPNPGWDWDGNGAFDWTDDAPGIPPQAFNIGYRLVGGTGASGTAPPSFPRVAGQRFTDNNLIWESFDNRRPLRSIRVTLRFIDQKTQDMRQLTLELPLTPER